MEHLNGIQLQRPIDNMSNLNYAESVEKLYYNMNKQELLNKIPAMEQRQDSVTDQINDLIDIATKLGMYDARDWLQITFYSKSNKKYCI